MISLHVNNTPVEFEDDAETPLLWVLREHLKLKGAKFGCGIGQCGACTVHVNGVAQRSCVTTVASVTGKRVTTIEGLAPSEERLHPVQQAWLAHDVPQCGYCQAGQIMAAAHFLQSVPRPTDEDIDRHISNICRCGTYVRIRKAIHHAAQLIAKES